MKRKQTPAFLHSETVLGNTIRKVVTSVYLNNIKLTNDSYSTCKPLNRKARRIALKKGKLNESENKMVRDYEEQKEKNKLKRTDSPITINKQETTV